MVKISILVIFRDEAGCIQKCIESLLCQQIKEFELVLIDDASSDGSTELARSFKDRRIRHFRNDKKEGISRSRNLSLSKARGKYLFFTDADCTVSPDWLAEGLKYLEKGYAGVEGKTLCRPEMHSISYKKVENLSGNEWMTCNMAYDAASVRAAGGFDERFKDRMEDRDLAFKVMKKREIVFNKDMIVIHSSQRQTGRDILTLYRDTGRAQVLMFKIHNDRKGIYWRIVNPAKIAVILFPPSLFYLGYVYGIKEPEDLRLLCWLYVAEIAERISIWKTAFEEKVFLF